MDSCDICGQQRETREHHIEYYGYGLDYAIYDTEICIECHAWFLKMMDYIIDEKW